MECSGNPPLRARAKKGNPELVSKGHPVVIWRMFPDDGAGGVILLVRHLCLLKRRKTAMQECQKLKFIVGTKFFEYWAKLWITIEKKK